MDESTTSLVDYSADLLDKSDDLLVDGEIHRGPEVCPVLHNHLNIVK